jgi:hypothetical protein
VGWLTDHQLIDLQIPSTELKLNMKGALYILGLGGPVTMCVFWDLVVW